MFRHRFVANSTVKVLPLSDNTMVASFLQCVPLPLRVLGGEGLHFKA